MNYVRWRGGEIKIRKEKKKERKKKGGGPFFVFFIFSYIHFKI